MKQGNTLVIGASGQIGTDLVAALRKTHGSSRVVAADIRPTEDPHLLDGPFEVFNVMDQTATAAVIQKHNVDTVYLLAAMLSARAEQSPLDAWNLNMTGLLGLLEMGRERIIDRLFWPSSIAVFGPSTPKENTAQHVVMEPNTVYGISKLSGERWCAYYHEKHGVDVRSLRYPGLISHSSPPGGGTTDYAVEIFHAALERGHYTSFLQADTRLPLMYMEDAIRATMEITEAPAENVRIRSAYNLSGFDTTPEELGAHIRSHVPAFTLEFAPDFRQHIADSWPDSIDDSSSQKDWNWAPKYDLATTVQAMLLALKKKRTLG